MKLITLATSRWGPSLALIICKLLPRRVLYWLCSWMARYLARCDTPFVRGLRGNLSVVLKTPVDHPQVSLAVTYSIENMLCGYVDLFRTVASDLQDLPTLCRFDRQAGELMETYAADGRGLLLVGAHVSSFDLLLLRLKELFPAVQVLSNATPKGSSCAMNDLRREHGLVITPISTQSLRQAIRTLRAGGVVVIAADLPATENQGEELIFFERKTRMLVGHARLALAAGARMVVGSSYRGDDDYYRVKAVPIIQPPSTGDKQQDVHCWAQKSLLVLERFISYRPEEWVMPQPLWPPIETANLASSQQALMGIPVTMNRVAGEF